MARTMTGAEMVITALIDQGVEHIFGYPGGAVLPIYDELFQQDKIKHILVRQEGGARARRRRLRALDRQGGRRARDVRPRRHQLRHRPHGRADGFHSRSSASPVRCRRT